MYNPDSFLSIDLMQVVLGEFDWPAVFELEDELPDGIVVSFPNSNFFFREGFESEIEVQFFPEDTGAKSVLNLKHALSVTVPAEQKATDLKELGIDEMLAPGASEEKAKGGIRNACILIQTYLLPVVEGDFSWVEKYQLMRAAK